MIKPPNPYVLLAGVALFAATAGYAFVQGQRFERGQQASEEVKLRAVEDRALIATAKVVSGIRITNKTIYQETQREVFHNPVYTDCRVTPDGLQLLNSAIEGRAIPRGDSGVSAPAGAP